MKMPAATASAVQTFEKLVPVGSNLTVRKMFGQPAAFAGGNLFLGVFGEKVFLRLSEKDQAEAVKLPGVEPFEPMEGRPMRGYVVLPRKLLEDVTASRRWVAKALHFASALPPKGARAKGRPGNRK